MATKKKKRAPKATLTPKATPAKAPAKKPRAPWGSKKREREAAEAAKAAKAQGGLAQGGLVDSFTGLAADKRVDAELARAERADAEAQRLRTLFRRGYIYRERSPEAWLRSEAHRYRQEIEFEINEPLLPASLIGGRFKLRGDDYARECTDLGYEEIILLGERGRYSTLDTENEHGPRVTRVSRDVMLLAYSKHDDRWSLVPQDPAGLFDELYEFYDIVALPGVPHALEFKPSTEKREWYTKRKAEAEAKAKAEDDAAPVPPSTATTAPLPDPYMPAAEDAPELPLGVGDGSTLTATVLSSTPAEGVDGKAETDAAR